MTGRQRVILEILGDSLGTINHLYPEDREAIAMALAEIDRLKAEPIREAPGVYRCPQCGWMPLRLEPEKNSETSS